MANIDGKVLCDGKTITKGGVATFDAQGNMLISEVEYPGFLLPEMFLVELEEGVVITVIKSAEGSHVVDERDMDVFVPMVFG